MSTRKLTRKSVLLTRDDLKASVMPILKDYIVDQVKDFFNGTERSNSFGSIAKLHPDVISMDDLIQYWCDLASEDYFKKNTDVVDVLVERSPVGAASKKELIASRDDWKTV